ncbi:MAG: C40 family peptidase [Desulfovibrio sp.]|nr:C40 family peptidase [Desulfovibrio sp.]
MVKHLRMCALLMWVSFIFGCAAKQGSQQADVRNAQFHHSYEAAFDKKQSQASLRLLRKAQSAIGVPYVRGGTTPGGFDCSGFVSWAYKSVGVALPRTAREQSGIGRQIGKIEDMRAGDIVAFRHPRRGYHTGIYVGDGKFIHSPHRRTTVRITSLDDPYFSKSFLGARRVSFNGNENLVAQAENRLNDYAEEKALRDLTTFNKKRDVKTRRNDKSGKPGKATQLAANDKSGKKAEKGNRSSVAASKKSASANADAKSKPSKSKTATVERKKTKNSLADVGNESKNIPSQKIRQKAKNS